MTANEILSARNRLVEEYRSYVQSVVGRLVQTMNLPVQLFDEFVSAGYLGLVEAAGRFDYSSGRPFKNFAYLRIRGAIIDSIRLGTEKSTRGSRKRAAEGAQELVTEREAENNRVSLNSEDENLSEILDLAAGGLMALRLSMTEAETETIDDQETVEDPETVYLGREYYSNLRAVVANLPEKEQMIVEEFYFQDLSFVEILERHPGMSKSWISRLHSRALDLIKTKLLEEAQQQPKTEKIEKRMKSKRSRPSRRRKLAPAEAAPNLGVQP